MNGLSQDDVNEIMAGMEKVWAEDNRQFEERRPSCHFTKMEFHMAEEGESWFECRHCGHTKEA